MTDLRKAAEDLLEGVEAAIKAGDWKVDGACDQDSAIVRLRQALAQPDDFVYNEGKSYRVSPSTGSFGIGDTPSKQKTEWIEDGFGTMWQKCGKKDCGKFVVKIGKVDCWNGDCPEINAPPKREWQGLTDEEREELMDTYDVASTDYAQAIEAKLKEKNT